MVGEDSAREEWDEDALLALIHAASADANREKQKYQEGVELLFFFSSRRRHTRLQGDWSSDVCSSDLPGRPARRSPGADGVATRRCGHTPGRRRPRLSPAGAGAARDLRPDAGDRL